VTVRALETGKQVVETSVLGLSWGWFKLGCNNGQDHRSTTEEAPALARCLYTPKFQGFPTRLFSRLVRERETGQNAWLTCGKGEEMLGYLCEVARCEKTPSKSTFWAAKRTKKAKKRKEKVQRRLMEGVGILFFPLEGAG
jgi:hypothetical protein